MTTTYATQVTPYFNDTVAAAEAGGAWVNLIGGTLVVGDGNGAVPSISALIAANGVTHEVWRGTTINAVNVDANNAAQLDVQVMIPAAIGGVEIGPFTVREFAILDATGNCCIVGTTNLEKTTSAQGQISDLVWIAAIVHGVGAVTVTPPSSTFLTIAQLVSYWNANLPTAAAPITQTDTVSSAGVKQRVFGARLASKPADPVTSTLDANAIGVGRPSSDGEFAAFAPTAGRFAWPWATLQQIGAMYAGLRAWVAGAFLPLVGGRLTGGLTVDYASPQITLKAAANGNADLNFVIDGTPEFAFGATKSGADPILTVWNGPAAAELVTFDGATNRVVVAGDPLTALGVATKQYADGTLTPNAVRLPNGWLLQWGQFTASTGSTSYGGVYETGTFPVSFSTAFPSACYGVVAAAYDINGQGLQEQAWVGGAGSISITNTGFLANMSCRANGVGMTGFFIAIGV
jgi:hypothetical protein